MYLTDKLEEALREMLKNAKDWERKSTTVPGVFILKLPKYKTVPPRLVVEINPVDEYSRPRKRRGLIIRNSEDLNEYRSIIQNSKLNTLLEAIDKINPSVAKKEGAEGALEI